MKTLNTLAVLTFLAIAILATPVKAAEQAATATQATPDDGRQYFPSDLCD